MSSLVALILGSGPGFGHSLATLLKQNGYAVAVGSRNPDVDRAKKDGFFPVQVDVAKPDTIKSAFAAVNAELGAPNVVVYNAAVFNPPPNPADPLSLSLEAFTGAISIGSGVFAAAQQALPGFRSEAHKDSAKAFIVAGNVLPFAPPALPMMIGMDTQKSIQARLINLFSKVYSKEDIRFYFASLVSPAGTLAAPDVFATSASTRAQVHWDLVNQKEQQNWDHRFTPDGKKLSNYD